MPRKRPPRREVPLPVLTRREKAVIARRASGEIKPEDYRRCTAKRHGTNIPCRRWAIIGGYVCVKHGGLTPQVREAAKQRLLQMLDPTLARLAELRDQDEHPPTALGACVQILNRTLGPAGKTPEERKTPVINIGIAMGGSKAMPEASVTVPALPAGAVDADIEEDELFTEDGVPKDELDLLNRG